MDYRVLIDRSVINTLNEIDDYCIKNFGNYNFSNKIFQQIIKVQKNITQNPSLYPSFRSGYHKVILTTIGYNLYYKVDKKKNIIIIYKLKSFKQNQ